MDCYQAQKKQVIPAVAGSFDCTQIQAEGIKRDKFPVRSSATSEANVFVAGTLILQ